MILDCYVRFIVSVVFNFYFAWYEQILQNEKSYCKFGNFCDFFFFFWRIALKDIFAT